MTVIVSDVTFEEELGGAAPEWFTGNVGDKVLFEAFFTIKAFCVGSVSRPFIVNNTDGYVGDYWVTTNSSVAFKDFNIGDTIRVFDQADSTTAICTILDKIGNTAIQLNSSISGGTNISIPTLVFSLMMPTTAVRFAYNLIPSTGPVNYLSLIDGSYQEAIVEYKLADDAIQEDMVFQGSKCYQIGSVKIQGQSIDDGTSDGVYKEVYRIRHEFYITPLFLANQYASLLAGIKPGYFLTNSCLKYIYKFTAMREFTNPEHVQEVEVNNPANTGHFNENFNNNPTLYSVGSIVYKNLAAAVIDSLELTTDEQTITIVVNHTGAIFSNTMGDETPFVLGFFKTPENSNEYTNNGKTLSENFIFDRVKSKINATTNGGNFGTSRQVIKHVTSVRNTTQQMTVTVTVALSTDVIADFQASARQSYAIILAVQDVDAIPESSDKVTLLVDMKEFSVNTEPIPGLVRSERFFYRHYEDENSAGADTLNCFPEDECVAYTSVCITDSDIATSNIASINCKILARDPGTLEEFDLDSYTQPLASSPVINNYQFINLAIDRPYIIPTTEIRKQIKFRTRTDLQTGNKYYFDVFFPFMIRWEYWQLLTGVANTFFDVNEPQNGFNNQWERFYAGHWDIKFQITVNVVKGGILMPYTFESPIEINDYYSNPDFVTKTVKSYDPDTNVLLYDPIDMRYFLLPNKKTRIEAIYEFNAAMSLAEVAVVIGIEPYEQGGITVRRSLSSMWPRTDTWFSSIDGDDLIKMEQVDSSTVKASCYVDNTLIPAGLIFKIVPRIYKFKASALAAQKITEGGDDKLLEDGVIIKIIE